MTIRFRDPVAICDVCFKEYPAEADAQISNHWRHPQDFISIKWRSSLAKCCSKQCAMRHIEAL